MTNRQVNTRLFGLTLVLCLLSYGALQALAQDEHPVTGRKIAPVMGVSGAEWLERSQRDGEEMPEAALDAIGIQKGMTVADVGAGVGYFSIRMANRVGPEGKVYANDVQPEMLAMLKQRAAKAKVSNIIPVLGTES